MMMQPLSERQGGLDSCSSGKEFGLDSLNTLESANDRIAALRQQFMSFRKQSEVMNIKPLEMNHEHSEANLTSDSPLDNHHTVQ